MRKQVSTRGPRVEELTKSHDALLVLDVDEVVLEFIAPFSNILDERGARLHPESFRLTGNVRSISTGTALTGHELDQATALLYEEQEARQFLVRDVSEALSRLSRKADIVFLTAMTPSYYDQRRRLLDREGLTFPMIATKHSKGTVVAELGKRWKGPIVFVDDLPPNLETVRRSLERVHLVHLMANDVFRPHLPPLPRGVRSAADWKDAAHIIEACLTGAGETTVN